MITMCALSSVKSVAGSTALSGAIFGGLLLTFEVVTVLRHSLWRAFNQRRGHDERKDGFGHFFGNKSQLWKDFITSNEKSSSSSAWRFYWRSSHSSPS